MAYDNLPSHNQISDDFVAILKRKFKSCDDEVQLEQFDVKLRLLAYEYITQIAFDTRLNCIDLSKCDPSSYEFVQAVDDMVVFIGKLVFNLPYYRHYPTKDWKTLVKVTKTVYK